MPLSLPVFPNDLAGHGNNLASPPLLVAGLVWHMLPSSPTRHGRPCLRPASRATNLTATTIRASSQGKPVMANAQLQPVLAHIDADIDGSLERLFALLRIKSISTDPAFAGDCKAAAEHLQKDLPRSALWPMCGRPEAIRRWSANPMAHGAAARAVLRPL